MSAKAGRLARVLAVADKRVAARERETGDAVRRAAAAQAHEADAAAALDRALQACADERSSHDLEDADDHRTTLAARRSAARASSARADAERRDAEASLVAARIEREKVRILLAQRAAREAASEKRAERRREDDHAARGRYSK